MTEIGKLNSSSNNAKNENKNPESKVYYYTSGSAVCIMSLHLEILPDTLPQKSDVLLRPLSTAGNFSKCNLVNRVY